MRRQITLNLSMNQSRWCNFGRLKAAVAGLSWWGAIVVMAGVAAPAGAADFTPGSVYENSLGMKFEQVPQAKVWFSVWETRERDYAAYAKAAGVAWTGADAGPTHPAVNVSWTNAVAFCAWLTKTEQAAGRLAADRRYRLPTDEEWSLAVGLLNEARGATPEKKMQGFDGIYPWGKRWPPPRGSGNFDPFFKADDFKSTSPVGSFKANLNGLFDMGGNVWEWVDAAWSDKSPAKILRGGSYTNTVQDYLKSSGRIGKVAGLRDPEYGFRCVIE